MTEEKSKLRDLHPRRLTPPPEAAKRFMDMDKTELPRNPVKRFFRIFCGEGF
jgi:hypothetical protein